MAGSPERWHCYGWRIRQCQWFDVCHLRCNLEWTCLSRTRWFHYYIYNNIYNYVVWCIGVVERRPTYGLNRKPAGGRIFYTRFMICAVTHSDAKIVAAQHRENRGFSYTFETHTSNHLVLREVCHMADCWRQFYAKLFARVSIRYDPYIV